MLDQPHRRKHTFYGGVRRGRLPEKTARCPVPSAPGLCVLGQSIDSASIGLLSLRIAQCCLLRRRFRIAFRMIIAIDFSLPRAHFLGCDHRKHLLKPYCRMMIMPPTNWNVRICHCFLWTPLNTCHTLLAFTFPFHLT